MKSVEHKHGIVAYYLDTSIEPEEAAEFLTRQAGHYRRHGFVRVDASTPVFDHVLKRWHSRPDESRKLTAEEIGEWQSSYDPDTEFLWVRSTKSDLTTADLIEIHAATYGLCR